MNRKMTYFKWIKESILRLEPFQSTDRLTKGCMCLPYLKKEIPYVNSRWQEAALSFAWMYSTAKQDKYKTLAYSALDYWTTLQHTDGSFGEYSKQDRSFAATAFTTLAVLHCSTYLQLSELHLATLKHALTWLSKNNEVVYTNQQAAAATALFKAAEFFNNKEYLKAAQDKLNRVFKNQHYSGYYNEKGFDLGYNSLTLEMLGLIYLQTKDKQILSSAEYFLEYISTKAYPQKNSRGTTWVLPTGFEIFAPLTKHGEQALHHLLTTQKTKHLEQDINLCTDLYRYMWAHDHCTVQLTTLPNEELPQIRKNKPSQLLKPLRRIGLHTLRTWLH